MRLHSTGFVGQDGILRAGWQPAPGGHMQASQVANVVNLPHKSPLSSLEFCEPPIVNPRADFYTASAQPGWPQSQEISTSSFASSQRWQQYFF